MSTDDPDDDDLKELFWEHVAAYEAKEPQSLVVELKRAGVALPPPDELDDSQLADKLWEVINTLALMRGFLHNTNHLSDRQLYCELVGDVLLEEAVLMPEDPASSYHIDMVGSGSEEYTSLYLKYYANEEERRSWLEQWPEETVPDHEDPLSDRDRLLPQVEYRIDEPVM